MFKRLLLGLIKGSAIGGALGAAFQFGLGLTDAPLLLGFLIAMGIAGTAGIFAGRPPWQKGAWIEASLKGLVGVGLGALTFWGLTRLNLSIPFFGLEGSHALTALPAAFGPIVGAAYGALVELDNTGDDAKKSSTSKRHGKKTKARVEVVEAEEVETPSRASGSKKARS